MQIKCSDCNCIPHECANSVSPLECPYCSLDKCCCWDTVTRNWK